MELRADCSRCAGLCCVAPAFEKSSDFAITKPAGRPCPHLAGDFRCGIHDRLEERGFHGCRVFDCFGAGQRVTQETFGGRDWRSEPAIAGPMFAALPIMRQLHELLWYVSEALKLPEAARLEVLVDAAAEVAGQVGARPAGGLGDREVGRFLEGRRHTTQPRATRAVRAQLQLHDPTVFAAHPR